MHRNLLCLLPVLFPLVFRPGAFPADFQVLVGKAVQATSKVLRVDVGGTSHVLYADKDTKVWKGKESADFSSIEAGDEVTIRYRATTDGKQVVIDLFANIEHVVGKITRVGTNGFEIISNPGADPKSAYRVEKRLIDCNGDTIFEESAREDLRTGRGVDIVGLKLRSGNLLATRVIVYEGNRPVRMGAGRVMPRQ